MPSNPKAIVTENDLMMYLGLVFKHLRLIALLISFSLLLGTTYYLYARPVYYAKSLIRHQILMQPVDAETVWRDSSSRVVMQAMKSPVIANRVAKRLGIKGSARSVAANYVKRVRLQRDSENNIIVEVHAYEYPIVRDWAKVMLDEYLAHRDEQRLKYAELAITSLTEYMAQTKERMGQAIEKKFDFNQTNKVDQLLIELNEMQEVPRQLAVIRHRLALMDQIRDNLNQKDRDAAAKLALLDSLESDVSSYMAKQQRIPNLQINVGQIIPMPDEPAGNASSQVVVLPSMMPTPGAKPWQILDKERHRLEQEMALKGRTFLSGHPQIRALQKQLDEVNKSLNLEFEIAYNTFTLEYANLLDKRREVEEKMPDYQDICRRHERLIKEYAQFDSGRLAWGKLYNTAAKKLDTIDFGFDKEHGSLEYMGSLEIDSRPVAPNRLKVLLYSLLLGLALTIAIPSLLEYLDTRVSDLEHTEESLRLRGLGVVPKILDIPFETLLNEDSGKSDYHLKENFRLIRTNLIMNSEKGVLPQVIVVTSAVPQEGKTVVAANLAVSFANKGEKTLLIDGDLRRGRMHRLFGLPSKPGLSNLLSGEVTLEQVCRTNGHENLTVMPCGRRLSSASELLDSPVLSKLMEDLRGKYQRIIVDTPPVLGLSETIIMQRVADGVLMVIWSGFTQLASVKSAVQALQVNGANFAGFVLNRMDFSTLGNRYKYFYYAPLYYSNYQPLPSSAPTAAVTKT